MTPALVVLEATGGYEAALMASKYGADITIVEDSGAGGSAIRKDVVPSRRSRSTRRSSSTVMRSIWAATVCSESVKKSANVDPSA